MCECFKKRIGKDLRFTLEVLTNGQPTPLEGRDISLFISAPNGQPIEKKDFSVDGNRMSFTFRGTEQKVLGKYIATIWENYGKVGQTVVDVDNIVTLVRHSWEEDSQCAQR